VWPQASGVRPRVSETAPVERHEELNLVISRRMLLIFVIGYVLGAGINALVGEVAGEVGGAIWTAFTLALILAIFTAFA
jgi:APA family basic amino acid/polyamine antiporter